MEFVCLLPSVFLLNIVMPRDRESVGSVAACYHSVNNKTSFRVHFGAKF
jgi:hypothetical protein